MKKIIHSLLLFTLISCPLLADYSKEDLGKKSQSELKKILKSELCVEVKDKFDSIYKEYESSIEDCESSDDEGEEGGKGEQKSKKSKQELHEEALIWKILRVQAERQEKERATDPSVHASPRTESKAAQAMSARSMGLLGMLLKLIAFSHPMKDYVEGDEKDKSAEIEELEKTKRYVSSVDILRNLCEQGLANEIPSLLSLITSGVLVGFMKSEGEAGEGFGMMKALVEGNITTTISTITRFRLKSKDAQQDIEDVVAQLCEMFDFAEIGPQVSSKPKDKQKAKINEKTKYVDRVRFMAAIRAEEQNFCAFFEGDSESAKLTSASGLADEFLKEGNVDKKIPELRCSKCAQSMCRPQMSIEELAKGGGLPNGKLNPSQIGNFNQALSLWFVMRQTDVNQWNTFAKNHCSNEKGQCAVVDTNGNVISLNNIANTVLTYHSRSICGGLQNNCPLCSGTIK